MSLTTTYDPQNIFAQIIRGDAPCYKLYEDDDVLAFLDLFPQSFGHTLVIPKRSAACNILDVDSEALAKVIKVVQKLTRAIVAELSGIVGGQPGELTERVASVVYTAVAPLPITTTFLPA